MSAVMAEFYDGPHATPPPSENGPIFLGIKNMTEDGHLDLSDVRHISEGDYVTWTRRVEPRAGDIVFTYEASLHRYAVLPAGFRGCLGRRVALFRPNPRVADARYLLYAFISPQWRRTVEERINIGSTVDRLPLVDFPNFPISVPPLVTQRKVAATLSAYDDLIENNNRRIKILEEMAQRIYREWFVDFRYPGHEGVPLVDSEHGPIPRSWRVCLLRDLVGVNMRTARTLEQFETIEYIDIASVRSGWIVERRHLGVAQAPGRARRLVDDGDVIWSTVRPNLRSYALIVHPSPICVVSTGFAVLSPARAPASYLYTMTTTDAFVDYLANHATGSAYPAVTGRIFENAPCVLPTDEVLQAFDSIACPAFRLAAQLRSANDRLGMARDLLLPGLISGEIDVENLDIHVEQPAA